MEKFAIQLSSRGQARRLGNFDLYGILFKIQNYMSTGCLPLTSQLQPVLVQVVFDNKISERSNYGPIRSIHAYLIFHWRPCLFLPNSFIELMILESIVLNKLVSADLTQGFLITIWTCLLSIIYFKQGCHLSGVLEKKKKLKMLSGKSKFMFPHSHIQYLWILGGVFF